ncbi:hypothetical protein [Stenotrophomonas sp.]|uniref:hypothetical protein n=1 Tax=Stenotrophomonas sp. TaxID=69392 RepID=UPI0028AF7B88|nr:hypothetical protein [Stenotrophomonas sp.]
MSWSKQALWTKAVLFMGRAAAEDREGQVYPLWAAMGLEILARAAVSNVSPLLLADPERDHRNTLYALGFGGVAPKSIGTVQVLSLCKTLIAGFTEEEYKVASSLAGRRNEELHSGEAAFATFPVQSWLPGFFRCCLVLSESMGESLDSLLGVDEAKEAREVLGDSEQNIMAAVKASIAAHAKVFTEKDADERAKLSAQAQKLGDDLSHQGHHRVKCPACDSVAVVQGEDVGRQRVEHGENGITVRQAVLPTRFSCVACGLKLNGYQALRAAGVADHFTRKTSFSPQDYYELIDPEDEDAMHEYVKNYADRHDYYEFNND